MIADECVPRGIPGVFRDFASRDDLAEAAAQILLSEGHEGKSYNFSNAAVWSYGDIAGIMSEITGKKIEYVSPEPHAFLTILQQEGVSSAAADSALA